VVTPFSTEPRGEDAERLPRPELFRSDAFSHDRFCYILTRSVTAVNVSVQTSHAYTNYMNELFSKVQLGRALIFVGGLALVALIMFHKTNEKERQQFASETSAVADSHRKVSVVLLGVISNLIGLGIMFASEMLWR
jgi:hypothetical protein